MIEGDRKYWGVNLGASQSCKQIDNTYSNNYKSRGRDAPTRMIINPLSVG